MLILFIIAVILFPFWSAPTIAERVAESLKVKPFTVSYVVAAISFLLFWISVGFSLALVTIGVGIWLYTRG